MNKCSKMAALALGAGVLFASVFTSCHKVSNDKEILVVSFGTSYNSSRDLTIGGIENAIAKANPDYKVARAFTADTIINILKERENLSIDNVDEALERASNEGIKTLVVQPTHLMNGFEYTDLQKTLAKYESKFDKVVLSKPLLSSDEDFSAVADAIAAKTKQFDNGETAVCFMGHGTEAESNAVYAKMQEVLSSKGFANYYIGTVEATPSVEDVLKAVQEKGSYKKVVLLPLMVVAGDHANNDMAGDEDDSWKSIFKAAGFEVECVLEGLGQDETIQQIYVAHTKAAIESL
ncbi:sirohydrochlorin cobaltochelatase [Treponema sp.]|uniref:sirohydrochlorin cobaltochelatase n=1 Tax=Treponema sp. TaxID=166 RepID=UPI00388FA995